MPVLLTGFFYFYGKFYQYENPFIAFACFRFVFRTGR